MVLLTLTRYGKKNVKNKKYVSNENDYKKKLSEELKLFGTKNLFTSQKLSEQLFGTKNFYTNQKLKGGKWNYWSDSICNFVYNKVRFELYFLLCFRRICTRTL